VARLHVRHKNQYGFSLLELMTALGITGVFAVAIMSVITSTNRSADQIQRESLLNRETENFIYALEQYVGQNVLLIGCSCVVSGGVPSCDNQPLAEAPNYAGTTPILTFMYENARDPQNPPAAGACLFNGVATIGGAASTIVPRGCKQVAELRYIRPTVTTGNTPSQPGELQIVWRRPNTPPNTAAGTVLARLTGVTRFSCTMSPTVDSGGTAHLSNSDMVFKIETKVPGQDIRVVGVSGYETWSPNETGTYASTYALGIHHTRVSQVVLRNLLVPGVQFGKVQRIQNCVVDGQAAPDFRSCCSGYRDPTSGNCVAASACILNPGTAGSAPAAPGGVADQCCSHMIDGGGSCL
jgi:prepilin-type N-terminal cleavage/methylation domain-containing protein